MSNQGIKKTPIDFKAVYYLKLGKSGIWEESSIRENKLRIGWSGIDLDDINQGNWDRVRESVIREYATKGAGTRDFNALKTIVDSTPDDIWITFHADRMWWCRVGKPVVFEDQTSKYRELESPWCDRDRDGKTLRINDIPGQISKTRGFRATVSRVKEAEAIRRLLNNQPSHAYEVISSAEAELVKVVIDGIRHLHWRDFEILVDLIFRNAGWQRVTKVGGELKFIDMELMEPIIKERYQVQVKSSASLQDFRRYADQFNPSLFRRLFFIVHTPTDDLERYVPESETGVELVFPERLAQMVVDFGLVDWVLKKIK